MALSSLRARRALGLTSSLLKSHRSISALTSSSSSILQSSICTPSSSTSTNVPINPKNVQSHLFHSSIPSLSSRSYNNNNYNDNDKIGPDAILFEGCDYMHWLITMDFPKDPAPTAEEMVETYVQTLAKVVGSVEEAKKRMYACSTTTYHGFQAVMTEEMSEKFRGLPGVVFILPDSYIDPKNKEYGGDKYINGEIIHRPPPVQFGREGGRFNRNERPRHDRPMQQGDRPYDRQSPMQVDGRNQPNDRQGFTPRDQQFDRQAPMQGGGRNIGPQQGYPPNYEQGGRQQPNFGQPMAGHQPNVEQPMAGHQPNIGPPMAGHQPNYVPPAGQQPNYGQPTGQPNYGQPAWQQPNYGRSVAQPNFVGGAREQSNYGQASGQQSNFGQMAAQQPNYGHAPVPGERVDAGFAPADDRGNYAPQQRREYAPVEHRGFRGDDTNFSPSSRGGFGQGEASGFGQGYSGSGAGQTFSATQSNNMQEEQRGYMGQQGMNGNNTRDQW
ncbi:hypothetical protein MKW92_052350 [Papaver armeniacum]|nr:hypothetical protein MKW92_052350 [Papaver armeniacum]